MRKIFCDFCHREVMTGSKLFRIVVGIKVERSFDGAATNPDMDMEICERCSDEVKRMSQRPIAAKQHRDERA